MTYTNKKKENVGMGWDWDTFNREFNLRHYACGNVPFKNMFKSNSFFTYLDSNAYKKTPPEVTNEFIRYRSEYILSICDCYAVTDVKDEDSVFAYAFYRMSNVPVVYFAYVKKSFRGHGLMKYLLNSCLDIQQHDDFIVSCPLTIPSAISHKFKKAQFYL